MRSLVLLVLAVCCAGALAKGPPLRGVPASVAVLNADSGYDWSNCQVLDANSDLRIYWNIGGNSNACVGTFQITQQRGGWIGIGFQSNASQLTMGPGDFYTFWEGTDGSQFAQDRYLGDTPTFGLPEMDAHNDLINPQVSKSGNAQSITFQRLCDTGDSEDLSFSEYGKSLSILHAFGSLPGGSDPAYHGPNAGKVTKIDLFRESSKCATNPCPLACSGHGTCDTSSKTCTCDDGFDGKGCQLRNLTMALKLPAGFKATYFASGITNARQMARSTANPHLLYVSTREVGSVYTLVDNDLDGKADLLYTIATGLDMPNGIAWRDGSLWVVTAVRILRADNIDSTFSNPTFNVVLDGIPTANNNWHAWKYAKFSPAGHLTLSVGSPCNYCLTSSPPGNPVTQLGAPWSSISYIEDPYTLGQGVDALIPVAHGIRNSVGFDWHPQTGDLFFTDNGRDNWGDNRPYDELNRVSADASNPHYGFPFCYGTGLNLTTGGPDPLFNKNMSCTPYVGATLELGAHTAPLGAEFYTGNMFPQSMKNKILVAQHGSWNRPPGELLGYNVVAVTLDESGTKAVKQDVFATGWLDPDGATRWGRPVDVLTIYDGSILVSDDFGNAIYRIEYTG